MSVCARCGVESEECFPMEVGENTQGFPIRRVLCENCSDSAPTFPDEDGYNEWKAKWFEWQADD